MIPFGTIGLCPKCGHDELKAAHCPGGRAGRWNCLCSHVPHSGEHVERTCGRCGYRWLEGCLLSSGEERFAVQVRQKGADWVAEVLELGVRVVRPALHETLVETADRLQALLCPSPPKRYCHE